MSEKSVYEIITDQILSKLAAGTVPWRKPWNSIKASGGTRPRNLDGRPYSGTNWFLLGMLDFPTPDFGTYKQIQAHGGQVLHGSKGFPVVYWKLWKHEKDGKTEKVPMLRYYTVFNASQCEGLILPDAEPVPAFDAIADAEKIWDDYSPKPSLHHGGDRACYIPAWDEIHLPIPTSFDTPNDYYNTLFHEAGHSTGHKSRLDRGLENHPTHEEYSREELTAELTAAFLSAECGLDSTLDQSASYVKSWLKYLESDPKAFVLSAGKAQRAADLILGRTKAAEKEDAA